ncbi:MAG TPA: hypothetical protein DCO71_10550 [Gammaproteobacteria bacterium]|nr:hypothetical protein [Gammaproteobacteria bacterium]
MRAVFYGKDIVALHSGMAGVFRSATGGKPTPVTLRKVIKPLRLDGGRGVVCIPTNARPEWFNGAVGTLQLDGPKRNWAAVPTDALILDGGRWWVLIEDAKGIHRQAVEPGPSVDHITLIGKGLKAGQQVVVTGAYLRFHRDFADHYQPPD